MLWLIVITLYALLLAMPLGTVVVLAVVGGYYRERDMWLAIRESRASATTTEARLAAVRNGGDKTPLPK